MNGISQQLPMARKSQLVTREVAGEVLVYDRNSNQAHCLNPTAAMVWAHCDGRTTIARMAQLLEEEMKVPVGDDVVWFALEQLNKSDLLDEFYIKPAQIKPLSRRRLVTRLGVAAAVTVPFIKSITAPTAAQAATCLPGGATCIANADCCSNSCVDNGRGVFQCT